MGPCPGGIGCRVQDVGFRVWDHAPEPPPEALPLVDGAGWGILPPQEATYLDGYSLRPRGDLNRQLGDHTSKEGGRQTLATIALLDGWRSGWISSSTLGHALETLLQAIRELSGWAWRITQTSVEVAEDIA